MTGLVERWRAASPEQRCYAAVVLALLALGLLLRTLGYFDGANGLWNDEANWVIRMARGISGGNIRPPGYVLLNQWIIDWHPSEAALRSSSYLAGVLALPLFVVMARRSGLSRVATCVGLFVVAVHPWAVAYAKEWKPYGLEFGLHVVLLALLFSYVRTPRPGRLVALALALGGSLLFAWNALFLAPGAAVAVLIVQRRAALRGQLLATFGLLVAGAVGVCALHWSRILRLLDGKGGGQTFWGKKYGVFYIERGPWTEKLRWMGEKTVELARLPGELRCFWDDSGALSLALGCLVALMALAGVGLLLWRRRWIELCAWLSPWLVTMAANWVGHWPYGVFRTNVFLLVYPLSLALVALTELQAVWCAAAARRGGARGAAPAFVGLVVLLLVPFTPWDLQYFKYKDVATNAFSTSLGRSLAHIQEVESAAGSASTTLFLDGYACGTAQYYTTYHPEFRRLRPYFRKHVRIRCADNSVRRLQGLIKRHGKRPFWVITARPASARPMQEFLRGYRRCQVREETPLPTVDILVRCQP